MNVRIALDSAPWFTGEDVHAAMTLSTPPTIRILYFDGCPNHGAAVALAQEVVDEFGIDAAIEEVEIHSADEAVESRFLGSPTIQIDGVDVEPAARERRDYAMACRTYEGMGVPRRELVEAALLDTAGACDACGSVGTVGARAGVISAAMSGLAAIAASSCCWVPLVLIGLGFSAAGVSAALWEWRVWLLAGAIVLLAGGIGMTEWHARRCGTRRQTRRLYVGRAVLLASAALIGVALAAPGVIDRALGESLWSVSSPTGSGTDPVELRVDGMHCAACAVTVREELMRVDGVTDAQIDFDTGEARVRTTGDVELKDLLQAVYESGFSGSVVAPDEGAFGSESAEQGVDQ